jgi:3'-phosphoadenosine 5'-phosphosulfate sulfotransferase (PAPS reductase)/FAD synthetase
MRDPFKIDGPACISFSGGRTSGYMLWRIIQAHGGTLPPDVVVCFSNTGKEREETLRFIRDCSLHFGVPIVWLEYLSRAKAGFQVVTFETAAREGEPFDRLIAQKRRLPNPVERACTEELKIKTMERYLASIGMRADEPHRIPKLRKRDRLLPLVDAVIGKKDVHRHWKAALFDLDLSYEDGVGNCDCCFLKTAGQVLARIREEPPRAIWWMTKEKQTGGTFHKDRPNYEAMHRIALSHDDMFKDSQEESIPCFCGD